MLKIENDVLIKYEGDEKEVIIPGGVRVIGKEAFLWCLELENVTIPDSVEVIGERAFLKCERLRSLDLPNSLVKIGDEAFSQCDSIAAVTIPASVREIGEKAFAACDALENITVDPDNRYYASKDGVLFNKDFTKIIAYPTARQGAYSIPDSVTEIAPWAFWVCTGLTEIAIPDSVIKIGEGAFLYCIGLTDIVIPDGVAEIGYRAFNTCQNIAEIIIPCSVKNIADGVFWNCENLCSISIDTKNENYASKDGVLFDKSFSKLICFPRGKDGCYIVPQGVTEIEKGAFYACTKLTGIELPDSLRKIGHSAFINCTHIAKIKIPRSVEEIGEKAFWNNRRLVSITVDPDNPFFSSRDGVLFNKDFSKLLCCPPATRGVYEIPDSVTEIGVCAFACCKVINEILIPDSVTKICRGAFMYCEPLASIAVSGNTEIGQNAFYGCDFKICDGTDPETIRWLKLDDRKYKWNRRTKERILNSMEKLDDIVVQDKVKGGLCERISAYKQNGTPLGNMLMCGTRGLGKTTLAHIIAKEIGVDIRVISYCWLPNDLAGMFSRMRDGDILLVENIHLLSQKIAEMLYDEMQKRPGLTLIGTAVWPHQITEEMRSWFDAAYTLEFYTPQQLCNIVLRTAERLSIRITPEGAREIASRSQGSPRIANRFLIRVRNIVAELSKSIIVEEDVDTFLTKMGVDKIGLDILQRNMLMTTILHGYDSSPVRSDILSDAIEKDSKVIEDEIMPYLVHIGFVEHTASGYCATKSARDYLLGILKKPDYDLCVCYDSLMKDANAIFQYRVSQGKLCIVPRTAQPLE